MKPIRIRKHVDSETLHLPELAEMIGQDVEITIHPAGEPLETLETFLGEDYDDAPPSPEELERFREAAKHNPLFAAILDAYEHDSIDVDAIIELRNQG